jgi:osmotically-inducible protein OsmY
MAWLDVTPDKLLAAPQIDPEEWPRTTEPEWDREVYAHYGYPPYWIGAGDRVRPREAPRRRRLWPQVVRTVLVLLLVVGLGLLIIRQGWATTAAQVRGVAAAVRQTTEAVRDTSADAAAVAKIKAALALSKRVSAFDIKVEVHNGTATLTGRAPAAEDRALIGQMAADIVGVREVRNLLTVDPATAADQERMRLAQRVEELERQGAIIDMFLASPEMDGAKVKVQVTGDTVALEGTVISDVQSLRAELMVRSLPWVRIVSNRLRRVNAGESPTGREG